MSKQFRLITGRTTAQGSGLHQGRDSEAYHNATALVQMNGDDMARLEIQAGATVRVRTAAGQVEVPVEKANLPAGMIFMPLGPSANRLIGVGTGATGMPSFKGLMAEVEAR